MKAKYIGICLVLLTAISPVSSQVVESNSEREKNFAFEVKQIDEFIDRFNNNQQSFFASFLAANFPHIKQARYSMLKSLFNASAKNLEPSLVSEFCAQITDTANPSFLDFYKSDWFAEARCRFLYKGAPIEIKVFLRIMVTSNGGAKWMIAGVQAPQLALGASAYEFPPKANCCKFLNPMSHATSFISLSRAFGDKKDLPDYLDTSFFEYPTAVSFIRELVKGQLKYQYVREIRYHFLEVEGWVFTVNQYRRSSVNSGWLISSLKKASEEEKSTYRSLFFK